MALTIGSLSRDVAGSVRLRTGTITFDSSYPTGGESLTPANLGLHRINSINIHPVSGYTFAYDYTNQKVLAYTSAGFTPAGTNSKPTFTVEAAGAIGANMEVGLSADSAAATYEGGTGITAQRVLTTTSPVGVPTFTGTAVAAAALAEVADTTNLSTVVAYFVAYGV